MALAAEILALQERALAELNAAMDYHSHTTIAWGIVRQSVLDGNRFVLKGTAERAIGLDRPVGDGSSAVLREGSTGTETTEVALADKARDYTNIQLPEATFQQFVSIFEAFLGDFLRRWLLTYPENLGKKQVDFKTILKAQDKDAITQFVVDKERNEVTYKTPAEWFENLEGIAKLGVPATDEIQRFAEAKASRDILVHNRGVANTIYVSKAGSLARYPVGDRIEIPGDYHREVWELLRKMVVEISAAAIGKVS